MLCICSDRIEFFKTQLYTAERQTSRVLRTIWCLIKKLQVIVSTRVITIQQQEWKLQYIDTDIRLSQYTVRNHRSQAKQHENHHYCR